MLGVKIMPGISTYFHHWYAPPSKSHRLSISGGISIKKEIKQAFFYLQSGIFIIDRGAQYSNTYLIKGDEINYFINIPVLLCLKLKWLYVEIGPGLNYLLKGKIIVNNIIII
ncbi:MAG: hypothetical protein ABII90_07055 [Bacteroidota bacterium]